MELEELHLAVLSLTALAILFADHEGYAYMRGTKQLLSRARIVWSHRLVWVGLLGMILTGIVMVVPKWMFFLQEPAFYVKMGFVLVLVVNAVAICKLSHVAAEKPFAELTPIERKTLLLSGALSLTGWVGAACIGFFFL